MKKSNSTSILNKASKTFLIAMVLLIALGNVVAFGQPAAYTTQPFASNIPGWPAPTAGANFRTPTVDWYQSKITGNGSAPNDFQWVNAGANPVAANQNIAGFPVGAGFVRYINRTVAYPAVSGAVIGDAAFLASRSLDWSGHILYSAFTDTIGISVWRDNTASLVNVLDYIEVYVNTSPSLNGATLALTTGGANRINRSSTQIPLGSTPNAWNRYQFVIPNEPRFWGPLVPGATSSAYVIIAAYSAGGNNIFIDNINLPQWQTNMQVTSASVIVTMNDEVGKNTLDNLMMGIQITTKGSLNPRRIDGMLFSSAGSTAFATDVVQPNGAKCWYTGGGSAFATTLGAASVPKVNPTLPSYTNGNLFFGWLSATTGCPLATAPATTNFFPGNENFVWLAYDIATGAMPGNNVAADFEQLFTSWTVAGCTGDTIVTSSGIQVPASVAAFIPAPSVSAVRPIADDLVYNIPTYSGGTSGPGGGYYNNDFISVVSFPGDNGTMIDNYYHDAMCASCVAVSGQNCNRFSCHPPDYTQFKPQNLGVYKNRGPLEVTQGSGVRTGGAGYLLRANCGTWFSSNTIGIFIDWNKDGDFDDRYQGTTAIPAQNGFIYENYGSHSQANANMSVPVVWNANSSWIINVPLPSDIVTDLNQGQPCINCAQDLGPIIVGDVRMRIREVYAASSSAPGVIGVHPTNSGYSLGEVEDYTIYVLPDCPTIGSNVCKWVGASNDWDDSNNWCPALPTKNDVAFINSGVQFMPVISDNTTAECRNLRIMSGANLGIDATKNSSLKVYDDLEIGAGATLGTGSSLAVTSDLIKTVTIPGKSAVPPAGLALATITPFRTPAQSKTQIVYTAIELQNTYGWKAGDIVDQISIEVNSMTGGIGPSSYQNLRIRAFLTSVALTFPFPATPNTKIAIEAGDAGIVAGYPKIIFPQQTVLLNMPTSPGGTQANGNYYTFVLPNTLPANTLIWDGFSNLVLSIENWTQNGLAPAKSYILYDEPNGLFNTLVVNGSTVSAAVVNGQTIDGAGHYTGGLSATVTAVVSNNRPRLDFKFHRPYNQFPITVCGDWINNNKFTRTTSYGATPVYGIPGDSGFIAGNSRVIFDPTGRGNVNSPGLVLSNPTYYPGIPGATLPTDVNQDITSLSSSAGNSTVFGALQIKKTSGSGKAVRQVSAFNPYLIGHYADTLILTNGELNLNRKEFTLRQPAATALTQTNGWLRSEDNTGGSAGTIKSKFTWKIGNGTTGTYAIPFKNKTSGTAVFNLKYAKNTAADNIGDLTVGTYSTASNNTPYTFPSLPAGDPLHVVAMVTDPPVQDATPWTVDRFWLVRRSTTGALTAGSTISFEYDNAIEGTLTAAYTAGEMKAQRYESSPIDTGWHAPFAGQTDGVVSGTKRVVNHPAQYIDNTYNIWAIVHTNATQPPLGGTGCASTQPTITPNGPLTFCNGSVTLTSSNASSYSWSTGATTKSITVSTSGAYVVTIIDASGCIGVSAPTLVNASVVAPVITANGSTTFCQNDSLQLTCTVAATYTWSTGATTQSIYVKTASTYYVVVANASGCTGLSNSIGTTVNTLPNATITAGGPTTFCFGDSVELTSSTGAGYLWSTGATTKKITVYSTGTYTVTVTKANGCTKSSAPVSVTASQSTPPSITANGPTTFCLGGSVVLTSSTAISYNWSTGATTKSITVSSPGSYFVITGSASGCSSQSNTIAVIVNQATVPVISATGPLTFCPGQNVILTSTPASAYLWSTGATTQSIAVSIAGNYQVTITDVSGCQGISAPVIVIVACPKPVGLTTTNITASSAKTNWGAVGCAIAYKLQYRVTGTTTWTTKNPTSNFRTNIGLLSSTQYDWRVATKCPDGTFSAYTAIQHFTTLVIKDEGLSISTNEINCTLFPNPTTGKTKLVFTIDKDQAVEINLLNMMGEKVMLLSSGMQTAGEKESEFNLDQISEGIYFVELITSEYQVRKKLIVIK